MCVYLLPCEMVATASASSSSLSPPVQLRPRGSSLTSLSIEPISLGQLVQSQSEASSLVNKRSMGLLRESFAGPEPQTPSELVRKSTAPTTIVAAQPLTLAVPQRQSSTGTTTDTAVTGTGSSASSSSGSVSGSGRTRRSSIRRHHAFPSSSHGGGGRGTTSRRFGVVNSYEHDDDDDAASAAGILTGGPHRPMLSVLLSLGVAALPPFARLNSGNAQGANSGRRRRRRQAGLPRSAAGSRSVSVSGSRSASRRSSFSLEEHAPMPSSPYSSHFYAAPPTPSLRGGPTPISSAAVKQRKLASKSFYLPVLFLLTIFVFTLLPIALALYSLPLRSFWASNSNSPSDPNAHPPSFPPKTIADISALASSLRTYAHSSFNARVHVLFVLSITAVWKHAWSIPGSVLVNVIAGSLYSAGGGGIALATLHMTFLTTLGSIAASMLSMPLAPLVKTFFPRALDVTRRALEGSSATSTSDVNGNADAVYDEKTGEMKVLGQKDDTPTWVRLVVMRLVGVVPWSGINVACGVCGVSMWDCFIGTFIGTLPWTAVTCQVHVFLIFLHISPYWSIHMLT